MEKLQKFKPIYKDKDIILEVRKFPPAKYLWARPAATLLPVTKDGKIMVMHEYKPSSKRWIWGFPGGMVEPGETPAEGAKRECEEELGLKVGRIKKITVVRMDFPVTSISYFLGFGLTKGKATGWQTEKIGKVKIVSVGQLYKLALDQKIHDPRMVVAVLVLYKKVRAGTLKL